MKIQEGEEEYTGGNYSEGEDDSEEESEEEEVVKKVIKKKKKINKRPKQKIILKVSNTKYPVVKFVGKNILK